MNEPLLEFKNVSFKYPNSQRPLLKEVSFTIRPGQRIGIVGDNGTGKSTIVKLILGLYRPNQGEVKLSGESVSWGNHYPQLSYIGDPSHKPGELGLPVGISVGEMIESFKNFWQWQSDQESFDNQLVDALNLKRLFKNDAGEISTGERKKLMALMALSKKTNLLIADEATEGLDKKAKPTIINRVKQASKNKDFGLLWISHRREEIVRLVDEIYELSPDEQHQGELIRLDIQGFRCEVEADLATENQEHYQNLDLESLFGVLGEILLNQSVSTFRITGTRNSL